MRGAPGARIVYREVGSMRTFRFFAPRVLLAAFVFAALTLLAPAATNAAGPPSGASMYVVQYGDTLESIAARYGVSAQAIMQANGMYSPNMYVGRQVYMPAGYGYPASSGNGTSAYRATVAYIVQPGDTLFGIAQRFGVSAFTLARLNNLFNPNFIFAGMRLIVPRAAPTPTYQTYLVRFGDSLSGIALRFGTSVYALMVANNIPNPNLIFAGMRLVVPGASTYGGYASASGYPPAPTPAATPTPGGSGGTTAVSMQGIAYAPKNLSVHVGGNVMWTNNEGSAIPHTVTSGAPNAPSGTFDSGTLNPGQSFAFTFNSPGTFAYFCRIHGAAMTGTITVTQ